MSRTTLATIKSFIKKNPELYISNRTDFNGMEDGVRDCSNQGFRPVTPAIHKYEDTLGIDGAWFVGSSRDSFRFYEKDGFSGYEIYNCCGKFILAIKV